MKFISGPHPVFDTDNIKEVEEVYAGMSSTGKIILHLKCKEADVPKVKAELPAWINENFQVSYTGASVTIQSFK